MTDETVKMSVPAASSATPADVIPAALPHPNVSSPLPRGIRYLHHFEIELVSCGKRLWASASAEGQKILAEIKAEKARTMDLIAAQRHHFEPGPPVEQNTPAAPPPPPAEIQEQDAAGNLVFDEKGHPRMIPNPALA